MMLGMQFYELTTCLHHMFYKILLGNYNFVIYVAKFNSLKMKIGIGFIHLWKPAIIMFVRYPAFLNHTFYRINKVTLMAKGIKYFLHQPMRIAILVNLFE